MNINIFKKKRNLLYTNRTLGANIELTTKCNLKCIYCAVQQPDYKIIELDTTNISRLIDDLKSRKVLEITVSGHGETTTVKNWHLICNELISIGCKLNIITNLSKKLTKEEVITFSHFNSILISCDSVNLEKSKSIRRGSDFRTVLYNISQIQAQSNKLKQKKSPRIGWTTVVCDLNIFELIDIVHFGISQGVRFFSFCNIVIYPKQPKTIDYKHITEMPLEEKIKIPDYIDELDKVLTEYKVSYDITSGIWESVEAIKNNKNLVIDLPEDTKHTIHRADHSNNKLMTKDCIDPWNLAFVDASGDIKPCFVTQEKLGHINNPESLSEILNNEINQKYRKTLLSGELKNVCKNCHCKGWITTEKLEKKVEKYYSKYDK